MDATQVNPPLEVVDEGDVRTLILNDHPTRNALSMTLVERLGAAIRSAVDDRATAVVITSAGLAFSAGFDRSGLDRESDDTLAARFLAIGALLDTITTAPLISIAVVDGPAVGAGADLALACDVRIATERARFRFPGASFGVVLGYRRLESIVGAGAALDLVTGRWVEPFEAQQRGLTTHRAPDARVARQMLDEFLTGLRHIDPAGLRHAIAISREATTSGLTDLRASLEAPGLHARFTRYVESTRSIGNGQG